MSYFETMYQTNVQEHIEKKNGLSYLSWAWAWGELKKAYPESFYTIYENENGRPWFDDGRTGWVKTGVTVVYHDFDGQDDKHNIEHIEYLPIMDFKNKSIPADMITSFDANKSIQRSLTKAVARHGLGLYVYAGEDLPECEQAERAEQDKAEIAASMKRASELVIKCEACGGPVMFVTGKDGQKIMPAELQKISQAKYGKTLCAACMKAHE